LFLKNNPKRKIVMNKKTIVYWASEDGISDNQQLDWSILFNEPENLKKSLSRTINYGNHKKYFNCPSFNELSKNIFIFQNPIRSEYLLDKENNILHHSENSISSKIQHKPSLINCPLIQYGLSFYFFSEEEIDMTLSSPFFSYSPYMQYASIVPGSINIGSWFRPINLEFNLWEQNRLVIEENEPIAYFNFNSQNQIILKRFKMNNNLTKISNTCSSGGTWEKRVSLKKRYQRFKLSQTKRYVLQEIKKQIIV
jgi:hypothetical protein